MIAREAIWDAVKYRILGVMIGLVGLGMVIGMWLAEVRGAPWCGQ